MRGSKLAALTRRYFLPILVLAFVIAFLFACRGRVRTGFPEIKPVDGVADARDIDFSQGVYHLVNSWEKYEGLYTPAASSNRPRSPRPRTSTNTSGV